MTDESLHWLLQKMTFSGGRVFLHCQSSWKRSSTLGVKGRAISQKVLFWIRNLIERPACKILLAFCIENNLKQFNRFLFYFYYTYKFPRFITSTTIKYLGIHIEIKRLNLDFANTTDFKSVNDNVLAK